MELVLAAVPHLKASRKNDKDATAPTILHSIIDGHKEGDIRVTNNLIQLYEKGSWGFVGSHFFDNFDGQVACRYVFSK